jgi:tRNA pseudouridine38-40 synthase
MQVSSRTVEGEFVAACQRLDLFSDWRKAGFFSAGRTDRGVHACGQVVAFSTEAPERAVRALNFQLPPDIWITGYAEVGNQFHPRFDARSRTYRYYYPVQTSDPQAMDRAARQFIGSHNFTNFARIHGKNPWRTILNITVADDGKFTCLEVTAESFLWHQVRCMAAALLLIGEGESCEDSIAHLLEAETDSPLQPAPAECLILWDTDCGITWTPVPPGDRSAAYLDHLVRHHALMENMCRTLRNAPVS